MYNGSERWNNEKITLLTTATVKKIPDTVLIITVVLGRMKFIPITGISVSERKIKLPKDRISLFSP